MKKLDPRAELEDDENVILKASALGIQKHAQLVANKTSARQANKPHGGGEVKNVILSEAKNL